MAAKNINKNETMDRLALAVFALEADKGHLHWKVTDIARMTKISRALVYRYFGHSKKEILHSALNVFTNEFYGFNGMGKNIEFSEKIKKARQYLAEHPDAILFYQKWRVRPSWIQEEFIAIENKFQKKLKKLFPHFGASQLLLTHALLHGLVTAPFFTHLQAQQAIRELDIFFRKGRTHNE